MIVLKGELSYFGLSNVLRFLYTTKATGILRLQREDKVVNVHVLSGKPAGVDPSRDEPVEGLVKVSAWMSGDFNFDTTTEQNIIKNISLSSDQLILLLAKKEKEIKALKDTLPSPDTVLIMNPSKQNGEIRLQPDEWNLLSKVDGKKTLEELVHSMDLDEFSVFAMVAKMLQKGILMTAETGQKAAGKNKSSQATKREKSGVQERRDISKDQIQELERVFVRYVGPMGTIILDEIIESLGFERSGIPQERFASLVEKMSLEIESEEEKRQFEEEVFKMLGVREGNA